MSGKLLESNIHFVVGMSRAGTTWMTKALNTHPSCAAFGETLYWGRSFLSPNDNGQYSDSQSSELINTMQKTRFGPADNDFGSLKPETVNSWYKHLAEEVKDKKLSSPHDVFYAMCEFVSKKEEKEIIVEKTPHHINWVGRIKKHFPKSKFIVMVREPYGFMRSYKNQGLQRNKEVRDVHKKQYHPIQAALVWRGYSRSVLRLMEESKESIMVIENNNLHKNSEIILAEVAEFIGLPYDSSFGKKIPGRTNSSVSNNKMQSMDGADYFWLNLVAKNEITKMGYQIDKGAASYYLVLLSIIKLPLWVFRTIALLRSNSKTNIFKYVSRWLK